MPLLDPNGTDDAIYAERVLVSREIVQIGQLVIRKRRITETKSVDIDLVREVTIEDAPKA